MRRETSSHSPRSLTAGAVVLLILLLISFFIAMEAAAQSGGNLCIKEQIGGNPSCTANDVRLVALDMISGPTSCMLGETVTLTVRAKIESSPERYDIGLWINEVGGSALSDPDGTCYRDYLYPASEDNSDCNHDSGPYYNGDGDDCGDVPAVGSSLCVSQTEPCTEGGGTCLLTFHTFTLDILCFDGDGNGLVDTGWATSWDNNAENECFDVLGTDPGTPSKCFATDTADFTDLEICTDGDGDGYAVEGGDCGPVDCDDSDPGVNPGAAEICDNGIDDDCDGLIDDADPDCIPTCTDNDGDGYSVEGDDCGPVDCVDDPSGDPPECETCDCTKKGCTICAHCINPGVTEGCCIIPGCFDKIDNDCDGLIDWDEQLCREFCPGTTWMGASTFPSTSSPGSKHVNYLALLLLPLAVVLIWKGLRSK